MNVYYDKLVSLLSEIRSTQADAIAAAGTIVGETVRDDGIVHAFGSGHSAAVAYEAHGRAGGLAAVSAIIPSQPHRDIQAEKDCSSLPRLSSTTWANRVMPPSL
jgi:uncharacterized phosphosugar-binding protein